MEGVTVEREGHNISMRGFAAVEICRIDDIVAMAFAIESVTL